MKTNNPIWLMTSAYPGQTLERVIERAHEVNAQGLELCVFRQGDDTSRNDHVATHLDYNNFTPEEAKRVIDLFNKNGLRFSIGAYDNLIGCSVREANQNHILKLIRIAALLGGDANDICVGTFVGYNHEYGELDGGFEKNLEEYKKIFTPIIKYAEDLGVTVIYENCPMEGWRPASSPTTYNNLSGTLAARKLMYEMIPSRAHGETYDPSHDVWQNINPSDVLRNSDMSRIKRIHIKGTRMNYTTARVQWGALYPQQMVNPKLAKAAGVCIPANDWDRHHYEATLPGFGGSDSIDWRDFINTALELGFGSAPFVIENEAALSKGTDNMGAIQQGFRATILNLSPLFWDIDSSDPEVGYKFDSTRQKELKTPSTKDIPVMTMDKLCK